MLTVHHLGISQSERIVWLCEELGIDYELKLYDRDAVTRLAPASYKALHPLGTAPVMQDGDVLMAESDAIVDYIIALHGNGRLALPATHPDFAEYLFWLHFANGSLMPAMMTGMVLKMSGAAIDAPIVQALKARESNALGLVESRLGQATYLAGAEFTAADIMTVFPLSTMRAFTQADMSGFPNIRAYLARIGARPAYQLAMAKGDPGFTPVLS